MNTTLNDEQKNFFNDFGYLIVESFFSAPQLDGVNESISNLAQSPFVDLYNDRLGKLRRMENFTFDSKILTALNTIITNLLLNLTDENWVLFKDKVNFKPPGGEGFYPHYDGVFQYSKSDGILKNGWYEYADEFINVLIALDDFTIENGALFVSEKHSGSFSELILNTKLNGTPDLIEDVVEKCNFVPALVRRGGLVIFLNTCPHKSGPNLSVSSRGSLYWTYNREIFGNNYDAYFADKRSSTNKFKALSGDLVSRS
ncbi:phytanoyl-CoA dioxygenase family protein [Nitrosomonas sp.]|uniref:phytanoyl-CoA dioxygenase family protein n=1 Tax=Nitrosomonas sp. TaxID=42353 RepID=UPI0025DD2646|nr:phytanoyl-CoA dioxygenase family protein [Nitrosomonas sp.]MBV6446723.1 hypothetical protein [Nitrosomonas sp.]